MNVIATKNGPNSTKLEAKLIFTRLIYLTVQCLKVCSLLVLNFFAACSS